MKIDMPNEKEIKLQIDSIIDQGLVTRESFYSLLKNMYNQIGLRHLFHDGLELGIIILFISSILLLVAIEIRFNSIVDIEAIYAYIFTVSPILYLTMTIFNFINTKQNQTFEIEMTCKYDIYQISAFRMLSFSIVSILFNFLFIYIISYLYGNINFLKAFVMSIASLFIFSTILLYAINTFKNKWIKYSIVLGWILLNSSLYIFKSEMYISILNNISIYAWGIVIVGFIYGYAINLKRLVTFRNKEGVF